jgi:hypothetical protein
LSAAGVHLWPVYLWVFQRWSSQLAFRFLFKHAATRL